MIAILEFALASWAHFAGTLALILTTGWAIGQFRPVRIIVNRD